jgi:hypothetical protein
MDMRCGRQDHQIRIGLWKSAMSVGYARADFIVFSMLCVPQKDNATSQRVMNNLSPSFQIISPKVLLVPTITVQPESPWNLNLNIIPLGSCGSSLSGLFIPDIVTAQMTFSEFHSGTRGGEEAPYYTSR